MQMSEVGIEVSHRCSLECMFCSSSAGEASELGELSVDEISGLITDARELGARVLSISGGEPLIYEPIMEVLSLARERGLRLLLYTCGVIFDEHGERASVSSATWEAVKDASGDDNLTVIFDFQGPEAQLVDRLMGYEGAFESLTASIRNAVAAGLPCECHMVPMKPNYELIPKTARLAESLGLKKMSFLRFVPQGRGRENIEELALDASEFLELQRILFKLRQEAANRDRAIDIRLGCPVDFQFLIDAETVKLPCRGGNDAPLILPNGAVQMCPAWKDLKDLSAGNIRNKSLGEVWNNSEFYRLFRGLIDDPTLLDGECAECDRLAECKGGCTAQRILAHRDGGGLRDCLYRSPDPLCPLVCGLVR